MIINYGLDSQNVMVPDGTFTVRDVVQRMSSVWTLPGDYAATINGTPVSLSHIVKDTDVLEISPIAHSKA